MNWKPFASRHSRRAANRPFARMALASLCAAFPLTACAPSIDISPADTPRIDRIEAGLSQTPERPGQWPIPEDATLIPEAVETYQHSVDRSVANQCVDRFIAYRDSVEERDARLRGEGAAADE